MKRPGAEYNGELNIERYPIYVSTHPSALHLHFTKFTAEYYAPPTTSTNTTDKATTTTTTTTTAAAAAAAAYSIT